MITREDFTIDISDFVNLDKEASELEEEFLKKKREITLAAWTNIVSGPYPVDTGRSRGAWIVTVSQPSQRVPPATIGPNSTPFPPIPSNIGSIKLEKVAYITNNVHYTGHINEFGDSKSSSKVY